MSPTGGRDLRIAAAVAVAAFALQLPVRLCSVNLVDEGAVLHMADDIRHGGHPYADAVHYAFPGVFYLTAAAFALGGTSIATARTLAAGVFALATAVVYLLARWSHGRRGALAMAVAFLAYRVWAYPQWQMINYSPLAVTLVLLAAWLVGEALPAGRAGYLAIGGVAAGLAMLAKQDCGLAGAAALAVAAWMCCPGTRVRAAGVFVAGAGGTLAAAAGAIVAAGFAGDLVRETILAPLYGARHFDYLGRPALWPLFGQDAGIRRNQFAYFPPILLDLHGAAIRASRLYRETAVFDVALKLAFYLPIVVLGAAVAMAVVERRRGGEAPAARRVVLVLLGGAFLAAFNRPHDWVHLLVLYPPTLLLLGALLAFVGGRAPRVGRVLRGGAWGALGAGVLVSGWLAVEFAGHHDTAIRSSRGTLYGTPAQARTLQPLLDALAAAPPGPLAALPYHPLLNFLAARPSASRYQILWPVDPWRDRDETVIRALEASPPPLVVYSPTEVPHFPRLAAYAAPLFRFLVDRFRVAQVFGGDWDGYTFLLLAPRPPAVGRSLLGPALAAARITEERPAGQAAVARRPDVSLAGEDLWPVEPVLRVAALPGTTVAVSYRVTPAAGERFVAAYGVNPEQWAAIVPGEVRFGVVVRDAAGAEHALVAGGVDPLRRPNDRRWIPVTADLSPWAGVPIDLVLRVYGPPGMPPQPSRAGWANPRVTADDMGP